MADITKNPIYTDEAAARAYIERLRWPQGVICVHCGAYGDAIATVQNTGKRTKPAAPGKRYRPARDGLYYCNECKTQFSVTVGTIMEDSHLPLHKWLLAFRLLCSSKKGMSSHQLHRTLGVSYKTAWHLSHRIRECMRSGLLAPPMGGGQGNMSEADETFIGRKEGQPKGRAGYKHKQAVLTLIDRQSGEARSFHIDNADAENIIPIVRQNAITTDEASYYSRLNREYFHATVNHGQEEWVVGEFHTNTVEGLLLDFQEGHERRLPTLLRKASAQIFGRVRFQVLQPRQAGR